MNTERVRDWYPNQGPRDEDGKIKEGWQNNKRIVRYKKYGKIQEGWGDTGSMARPKNYRKVQEGQEGTRTGGLKFQIL